MKGEHVEDVCVWVSGQKGEIFMRKRATSFVLFCFVGLTNFEVAYYLREREREISQTLYANNFTYSNWVWISM